jgi:hypothetical protein
MFDGGPGSLQVFVGVKRYVGRGGTLYDLHPEFIRIGIVAGAANGEMRIHISPDLYGSTFFDETHPQSESELIPVKTLDDIANQQQLCGRGISKSMSNSANISFLKALKGFFAAGGFYHSGNFQGTWER